MRTTFTMEDIKNIVEDVFNGNLKASNLSGGKIPYVNKNSEEVIFIDENSGLKKGKDLAQYLNIDFYAWKERLIEKQGKLYEDEGDIQSFDAWVESLNFSQNESYALVEVYDEEATTSQDMDNATITGRVSFIIQSNKISNLDYYVNKIRNKYLGKPEILQNSFGDRLTCFLTIGKLLYDQEPVMTQLGETVMVSFNFRFTYLNEALTYLDTKFEFSLDGDDNYDENGKVIGETKYKTFPITKSTWQLISTNTPLPTQIRPDLTGVVSNALSVAKTFTFFDYKNEFLNKLRKLFWKLGSIKNNGVDTQLQDVNIPIYVRVTDDGETYVYRDVIDNMSRTITNGDFNISTLTLKGWGKIIS